MADALLLSGRALDFTDGVEEPGGYPGRNIILDITTSQGQGLLRQLAKSADFLIESFPPGYFDNLGLGHATLSKINPGIIATSITPFGQIDGRKDFEGSESLIPPGQSFGD